MQVSVVDRAGTAESRCHYPVNRPPLLPSPLIKLPLGCARLRMSCLPVTGDGPDAREWA